MIQREDSSEDSEETRKKDTHSEKDTKEDEELEITEEEESGAFSLGGISLATSRPGFMPQPRRSLEKAIQKFQKEIVREGMENPSFMEDDWGTEDYSGRTAQDDREEEGVEYAPDTEETFQGYEGTPIEFEENEGEMYEAIETTDDILGGRSRDAYDPTRTQGEETGNRRGRNRNRRGSGSYMPRESAEQVYQRRQTQRQEQAGLQNNTQTDTTQQGTPHFDGPREGSMSGRSKKSDRGTYS